MSRVTGFLMALIFTQQLWAAILRVPTDFPSPSEAITASVDGDTVMLERGTYDGHLFLWHNLTLASEFIFSGDTADIAATIVRKPENMNSQVINVNEMDSTSSIVGLTIRGGYDYAGGGISINNSSLVVRDNIITENAAISGGGIYCSGASPKIFHNTIHHNLMYASEGSPGGGICMDNGSSGEIAYNTITDNVNQDGGGIACARGSNPWIHNNVIAHNVAQDLGGGIRLDNSSPVIENNVIAFNTANEAGGILMYVAASPVIRNCIFWGNQATLSNNQIQINDGSPVISFCDVEGGWDGEGIIDSDPIFRSEDTNDFHLQTAECGDAGESPCIDAGDAHYNDLLLECSRGLRQDRSDIGAFGGGELVNTSVSEPISSATDFRLLSAFPNPFNSNVELKFNSRGSEPVKLNVYNLAGQLVMTNRFASATNSETTVSLGFADLPTGVYFARLSQGTISSSVKLVYLK